MKCSNVSRLLNRYVDNELPDNEHFYVKEHLTGCGKCTRSFNEISKLKCLLAVTTPYSANPLLLNRITEGIKNITPMPFSIPISKLLYAWVSVVSITILLSGIVLFKMSAPVEQVDISREPAANQILETPITRENMEKITLNLLFYTNGKPLEAPYVKF